MALKRETDGSQAGKYSANGKPVSFSLFFRAVKAPYKTKKASYILRAGRKNKTDCLQTMNSMCNVEPHKETSTEYPLG